MTDIGAELFEAVSTEFEQRVARDVQIIGLKARIQRGMATPKDISEYASRLGTHLRAAIEHNVSADKLPNGQMYYNIAEKILRPSLKTNYELFNAVAADIQAAVDKKQGIRIAAQQAELPKERIDAVIDAASEPGLTEETMLRRMSVPAETITRSYADDFVKANADFRTQAGIEEFIVRRDDGSCCEWCAKLTGKFRYPVEVPRDVWHRHDNCGCTVEHISGGMSTNVHTKQTRQLSEEQRRQIEQQAQSRPKVLTPEEGKRIEEELIAKRAGVLTYGAESGIINDARVIDSMFYADDYEAKTYTKEEIIENLKTSAVGLETIEYLKNNPQVKVKLSEDPEITNRGQHENNLLTIWLNNCPNVRVAGQTVVHEVTHHRYGIGGSQQAETICFAFEKMHKENRKYLTPEEWDTLVEIVKRAYWNLPAEGGVDHLERFDFIIKKG